MNPITKLQMTLECNGRVTFKAVTAVLKHCGLDYSEKQYSDGYTRGIGGGTKRPDYWTLTYGNVTYSSNRRIYEHSFKNLAEHLVMDHQIEEKLLIEAQMEYHTLKIAESERAMAGLAVRKLLLETKGQ